VADVQILRAASGAVPSSYTLPDAAELRLKAVYAELDGSGAAGTFLPCVTLLSDSGDVIGRAVDQAVSVAAGGSADVTWFPRVRRQAGVTAFGSQCTLLGSGNGTDTLTITLTKAVPARGILTVVFAQATIGDSLDTASAPDNAFDSNAVAGWVWATAVDPLIGLARETLGPAPPGVTTQCGSVARACTAADLGIGSTITVHFTTADPGLFHTAGLVIYENAYFFTVTQYGANVYGNEDLYPSISASGSRLSWFDDFGHNTTQPDYDCVMLTAMGAYPPVAGFQPFDGFLVGEIASGSVSVAAHCKPVPEFTDIDPGGTWPSAAQQLVGNYQYARPRPYS